MGAVIVVGGKNRIAQFPERPECTQVSPPELEDSSMRGAVLARSVSERDLADAPALSVGLNQNLLENVEIAGRERLRWNGLPPVKSEAARQIVDLEAQSSAKCDVQHPTQHVPHGGHIRAAACHVPGRDRHLGQAAGVPQVAGEVRRMRQIRVHCQDVPAARVGKARSQRATVSWPDLLANLRARLVRGGTCQLVGIRRDDNQFKGYAEVLEYPTERRQQDSEVGALSEYRINDRWVCARESRPVDRGDGIVAVGTRKAVRSGHSVALSLSSAGINSTGSFQTTEPSVPSTRHLLSSLRTDSTRQMLGSKQLWSIPVGKPVRGRRPTTT